MFDATIRTIFHVSIHIMSIYFIKMMSFPFQWGHIFVIPGPEFYQSRLYLYCRQMRCWGNRLNNINAWTWNHDILSCFYHQYKFLPSGLFTTWYNIVYSTTMTKVRHWSDFNSLAPVGFDYSLKLVNFKLITTINFFSMFCEIAIRWMPQHLTDH